MEPSTSQKRVSLSNEVESEEPNNKKVKTRADENEEEFETGEKDDESQAQKDIETRKNEEHQFLRLFTLVLHIIIYTKNVEEQAISKCIQEIIDSFKLSPSSDRFRFDQIDLRKWEAVCGYLYRYGSHGAGFARNRILNAVRNCNDLKSALEKPDVKIIALGSGPGNDVLGLCSVLADLKHPKTLEITMVDKIAEWKLCVTIERLLIDDGNFGKVSDLFQKTKVILKYCQVDLPGSSVKNQNYFKSLAEADVILIFRLVSILDTSIIYSLMKSLRDNIKDEALILLNHKIDNIKWPDFNCVYSWEIKDNDVYQSFASAPPWFGHRDNIQSRQPINVLRKRKQLMSQE